MTRKTTEFDFPLFDRGLPLSIRLFAKKTCVDPTRISSMYTV